MENKMKNSERVNVNDDVELIEFANSNVDSSVAEFKLNTLLVSHKLHLIIN